MNLKLSQIFLRRRGNVVRNGLRTYLINWEFWIPAVIISKTYGTKYLLLLSIIIHNLFVFMWSSSDIRRYLHFLLKENFLITLLSITALYKEVDIYSEVSLHFLQPPIIQWNTFTIFDGITINKKMRVNLLITPSITT